MASASHVRARIRAVLGHQSRRLLAIEGRSGAGKTRLLRELLPTGEATRWLTARDLVDAAVRAIVDDRYATFESAFVTDQRLLVIEHVEDLRGKPRTRAEVERAVRLRAAAGGTTLLTLTTGRNTNELRRWLSDWADLTSLRSRGRALSVAPPRSGWPSARARSARPD